MSIPLKDHRIYGYMSEPIRWAGLTTDEWFLLIGCFFLFLVLESLVLKGCVAVFGSLGIYLIKRLKKIAVGFSLTSYLHWVLGMRFSLPDLSPPSWKRFWLP
jgi:hypothetical protein